MDHYGNMSQTNTQDQGNAGMPEQRALPQYFPPSHPQFQNNLDPYNQTTQHIGFSSQMQHQPRHDASMAPPMHTTMLFGHASAGAQRTPDEMVSDGSTGYRSAPGLTDSSSNTLSTTSPSSHPSPLPLQQQQHYCPTETPSPFPQQHFANQAVAQQPSFAPGPFFGDRTLNGLPHPYAQSIASTSTPITPGINNPAYAFDLNAGYPRASLPSNVPQHLHFDSQRPNVLTTAEPNSPAGFAIEDEMPRNGGRRSSNAGIPPQHFPWPKLETLHDVVCDGQVVTPEIHACVQKNFFVAKSDGKWTCYRRNYFAVSGSFDLFPTVHGGAYYLRRGNVEERIRATGLRLCASVDGTSNKTIELVQHTPKRDNGPKTPVVVAKVSPTIPAPRYDQQHPTMAHHHGYMQVPSFAASGVLGPELPLQCVTDTDVTSAAAATGPSSSRSHVYTHAAAHATLPGQATSNLFERIQFKNATANNGKRRASQQYYHLIMELVVDVRADGASRPNWVKIAQRVSDKVVVRGRSPSHYKEEKMMAAAGPAPPGAGNYGGFPPSAFGNLGGHYPRARGGHDARSRHPAARGGPGAGYQCSADSSMSPTSSGAATDEDFGGLDGMVAAGGRGGFAFPSETTQQQQQQQLPPPKLESASTRYTLTEPRAYVAKSEWSEALPGVGGGEYWAMQPAARSLEVGGSRGFYA